MQAQPNFKIQPYYFWYALLPFLSVVWGFLLCGFLAHIFFKYIAYIVFSPFIFIFCAGLVVLLEYIKRFKLASAPFNILCSVLLVISFHAGWAYFDYQSFHTELTQDILASMPGSSRPMALILIEGFIREQSGYSGVIGFMVLQSIYGMPLTRFGSNFELFQLSGWTFWLYKSIETSLSLVVAVYVIKKYHETPFCRTCRSWYKLHYIGSTDVENKSRVIQAAQSIDTTYLDDKILDIDLEESIDLHIWECACADNDVIVDVSHVTTRNKHRFSKTIHRQKWPHAQAEFLLPPI